MVTNEERAALKQNAEEYFEKIKELQKLGLICDDGDFVPSVHYPPITEYPDCDIEDYLGSYTYPEDGKMDVYVHIPFCIRHCLFCHYPGMVGEKLKEKEQYIGYLIREMDLYLNRFGIKKIKPRSILLGGGTPTYMPPRMLDQYLNEFDKRIDYSACKQYNVDLDPNSIIGDEGTERCQIMKDHGIDRLTIGVQSLNNDVLKIMNRPHGAEEAIESVYKALDFGFDVNIEFIYGHPGQTLDNWIDVVDKALELPMNEIQLYRLKVQAYGDRQGIINRRERGSGLNDIPDFKTTMLMKAAAIEMIEKKGFKESLRRVYTKEPRVFSHYAYNQCCNQFDQVGFGLSAFSSYRDRFDINTQYFNEYYDMIDNGKLPITRGYIRPRDEQIRWAIVLPLKNTEVQKPRFTKKTGLDFDDLFKKKVQTLKDYGLLEETERDVRLTRLGAFVADEVCECFNSDNYKPFPRERYAEGPLNPYNDNSIFD